MLDGDLKVKTPELVAFDCNGDDHELRAGQGLTAIRAGLNLKGRIGRFVQPPGYLGHGPQRFGVGVDQQDRSALQSLAGRKQVTQHICTKLRTSRTDQNDLRHYKSPWSSSSSKKF